MPFLGMQTCSGSMHAHWGRPSTHAGYYFLGFRSLGTVLQNTDDELHCVHLNPLCQAI